MAATAQGPGGSCVITSEGTSYNINTLFKTFQLKRIEWYYTGATAGTTKLQITANGRTLWNTVATSAQGNQAIDFEPALHIDTNGLYASDLDAGTVFVYGE